MILRWVQAVCSRCREGLHVQVVVDRQYQPDSRYATTRALERWWNSHQEPRAYIQLEDQDVFELEQASSEAADQE